MSIVKLAFFSMPVIKEILYSLHGIISNIVDKIFKLLCVSWGELSGMCVDGGDESGCGLVEVGV